MYIYISPTVRNYAGDRTLSSVFRCVECLIEFAPSAYKFRYGDCGIAVAFDLSNQIFYHYDEKLGRQSSFLLRSVNFQKIIPPPPPRKVDRVT